MKKITAIIPFVFLIAACNQGAPSTDTSGITSGSQAWEDALNAGDIDAVVGVYTSDARVMPPNGKTSSGSDAIRAAFGPMIEGGLSVDLTPVEVAASGDIGYNVGTYVLTAGDEQVDVCKYMETWQRGRDGTWRLANDMYNSDMPAMAGGGGDNTHVMIVHEVDDAERWLAAWRGEDSRHHLFKENGAAHVHTLQSADNPNLTGLVISVSDMDAFSAMLGSEAGMAAAAEDGVKADTMIMLTDAE